jgi:predicted nuclease of predicted toxin-antitoxin system
MKLLLDECLPKKLKREFAGHHVSTVPEMGWASIKNGALLNLAETEFDVFITVDTNIQYQQNLAGRKLAIIQLVTVSNDIEILKPLMPSVLSAIDSIKPGEFIRVEQSAN